MSSGPAPELVVTDAGPVRRCTLARTSRRNALSSDLCGKLKAAVDSVGAGIALIAIDHAGDTFSSGADLREIAPFLTAKRAGPAASPTLKAIWELLRTVEDSDIPVVAVVDGRCLAGGLELALACDLIAATRSAVFFDGHLAGGLLPGGGAAIRLPERIGRSRAFRVLVEGIDLDADQALEWGLVDAVFDDRTELDAWVDGLGDRLAEQGPALARSIKRQLRAGRRPRNGPEFELEIKELSAYVSSHRDDLRNRLGRYLE